MAEWSFDTHIIYMIKADFTNKHKTGVICILKNDNNVKI